MIRLAWHTLRTRAGSLVGTFVALGLGVTLLAAMALTLVSTAGGPSAPPAWYVHPDVVVAGDNRVSVTTGSGEDRETSTVRAERSRGVPADVAERLVALAATGAGTVVVDTAGYATVPGAPGETVHPWSAADLHDWTWQAGGPPSSPDQLVLTAPTGHRPGDQVDVLTARGTARFTVSGVLRTDAPAAFYATDQVASELAGGRVEAVALTAAGASGSAAGPAAELAGLARTAVGAAADDGSVQVLTGNARRHAEPNKDSERRETAIALLSATTGLGAFVSIFVVSGTFTYAVEARRREFGLLRTAGATPRQVFRLVLGEAVAIGVLAATAGGALGAAIAPRFARWLAGTGFVPADFTARFVFWPVAAAFGVGLLVAVLGAWLAARRAGRVGPVEALREAAVDAHAMTKARVVVAVLAIGGCVPMLAVMGAVHSADVIALVILSAMLLVVAASAVAPLVIGPLVRLLTAPLSAVAGAAVLLARHNAVAAVRRTAATAAPVLVTVGIAGATLTGFGVLQGATESAARDRVSADAVVVPAAGAGLADATVAELRAVPGVSAAVAVTDSPVYVRDGDDPERWTGRYAPGAQLAGVLDVPVTRGSLADLTGTGTVAVPAGSWDLGETARLWLGDAAPVQLRVVAVFDRQLDLDETVLLPAALRDAHARPVADAVYLRFDDDAPGRAGPSAAVAAIVSAGGGKMIDRGAYLSAAGEEQARVNRQGSIAMLGMALLYTGIAIANTLAMSTGDRAREFASLRLSGATRRQVLTMVGVEAGLVTGVGVVLASAVTAVTVVAARGGLADLAPSVPLALPWLPLGGIALACLVVALVASLLPAAVMLRRPAVELAGTLE